MVRNGAHIDYGKRMGDIANITPLHHAVHRQNVEAVRTLVGLGCDVNAVTSAGHAPLHMACERGGAEIVVELIKNKASVNQSYSYRENINVTPLHVSAQHGFAEIVKLLIASGAEINAERKYQDRTGITALHLAAENGFLDTVNVLLEHGAEKDAQDSLGFTPVHLSIQYRFHNVLAALLQGGCSIKKTTVSGLTALAMAEETEDEQAITLLKDAKKVRRQETKRSFIRPNRPVVQRRSFRESFRGLKSLLCGLNRNS